MRIHRVITPRDGRLPMTVKGPDSDTINDYPRVVNAQQPDPGRR